MYLYLYLLGRKDDSEVSVQVRVIFGGKTGGLYRYHWLGS
jgi:hypothetical protein